MAWIEVVGEDAARGQLAEFYQEIGMSRGKVSNIMRIHTSGPRR